MSNPPSVRTAVIPAAGLGTRFLPAAKAVPKELMPILDRPALQWIVEEAVAAGAERIIIVTSAGKEALRRHFAPAPELEQRLAQDGKDDLAAAAAAAGALGHRTVWVEQPQQKGLGDAVLCAANAVGDCLFKLHDLVEKPHLGSAPSNLAIAGRYLLTLPGSFANSAKPGRAWAGKSSSPMPSAPSSSGNLSTA